MTDSPYPAVVGLFLCCRDREGSGLAVFVRGGCAADVQDGDEWGVPTSLERRSLLPTLPRGVIGIGVVDFGTAQPCISTPATS